VFARCEQRPQLPIIGITASKQAGAPIMYANGAVLALFVLGYCAIAGRVERTWITGPMVFTAAGFIFGPHALGLLRLDLSAVDLRVLAEGTLAMVLFTDAANADLRVVRGALGLPGRLLLIGLPLTILLGLAVARLMFPGLQLLELALLATMLAPTDAALGKPVLLNHSVPSAIREALNVESGLNDGICVPVVVILLGLAVGTQIEHGLAPHVLLVVVEELGIGIVVGLALAFGAAVMLRRAAALGWISDSWSVVATPALAVACFAVAQAIGGSGFIACFVGGLLLGGLMKEHKHERLRSAEGAGEALSLMTWLVFGSILPGKVLDISSPAPILYAVLSLTVVRMLPVAISLLGARVTLGEALFIGWFGPRGLASLVFAIMVFDAALPGNATLMATVAWTVVLSVIAHGISAHPLAHRLAARAGSPGEKSVSDVPGLAR
jgi:NhaP-type Na+/H+ or K+/H+ antiporter